MWSLRHQLRSTLCRWLLDQYLDDCPSWYHSQKIMDGDTHTLDAMLPDDASSTASTDSTYVIEDDGSSLNHQPPSNQSEDDRPPSPKRCKMAHFEQGDVTNTSRLSWPAARIPVELFEIITSYLTRAEVKTLRLVCREFEMKVSAQYFKNVVVPFRSELYGTLSRDETGTRQHPSSALFSNGMRIFESFGPHILRFALSLEIDEDALAHPPIKPAQEAVPSFWGIYRWPHATYNRYSDLESIEQTADETQSMKEALRCLTKVTNLGLCCDAGLGFLVRPDNVARNATIQQNVFAIQDWRRERRSILDDVDDPIVTVADFNGLARPRRRGSGDSLQFKRTVLEKMTADAGYGDNQTDEAIQLLLETEHSDLARIDFDERAAVVDRVNRRGGNDEADDIDLEPGHFTLRSRASSALEASVDARGPPLQPAELTQPQKELLLELEWAHRAMIQSYVIAMIDNGSAGCFSNLTTLTIAKIPSSHVHMLYRDDFWNSFPKLANVSLGVIADWRRISKPAPGCVDDDAVSPVLAVDKVHKLLNSFVGKQRRIESLHFEWICGGEFAPSFFQRNQYILPAPFLEKPEDMTSPGGAFVESGQLLSLPHIKHLSLKNCWASPHVFHQTIRQMGLQSLEKLELESVSLSGQPTQETQFPLGQTQMNGPAGVGHIWAPPPALHPPPPAAASVTTGFAPQVNPTPLPNLIQALAWSNNNDSDDPSPSSSPGVPAHPDWFTWAGILEHFSPGLNMRKHMGDQEDDTAAVQSSWESHLASAGIYLPQAARLIKDERSYRIKCLSLKSCGYVAIDSSTLKTRALFPPGMTSLGSPTPNDVQSSIQNFMQRSTDKLLGRIIPFVSHEEMAQLTDAFDMIMGWSGIYNEKVIEEAIADGIDCPGMGRFSGVLEST